MEWLDNALTEQYQQICVYKSSEEKTIVHLRHKTMGSDIICRKSKTDGQVYRKLLGVSHPNLPRILEAVAEADGCTVLEEFVDGITVHELLQSGLYSLSGSKTVGIALCNALDALHTLGIIHRDVKPENVMVENDGRIRLMDLDAARLFDPLRTADTDRMGTVSYAAPEQFGVGQSDKRTDLFSLGIFLNVLVTGEHPSVKTAKGPLGRIVTRCVQMDPKRRYQSAKDLRRALEKL